jgi:hypothetical protein
MRWLLLAAVWLWGYVVGFGTATRDYEGWISPGEQHD